MCVQANLDVAIESYDVFDAGPGLGSAFIREELSPDALRILQALEQADAIVAVTPVYKGSYPGLFKHLIDFIQPSALLDKPTLIGAAAGGQRHALVVEHQLRPLFGFFSALIVPTTIYASDDEFTDGVISDEGVLRRIDLAAAQLARLIQVRATEQVPRMPLHAPDLAVRR